MDVIHVVSLSQCPKATSLYTKYLQVHQWICLSLFLSLSSREGQFGINLSLKARKNNRGWEKKDEGKRTFARPKLSLSINSQ